MTVNLSVNIPYKFDILFTNDIFADDNETLARAFAGSNRRALFFLDSGVAGACPDIVERIDRWCQRHAIQNVTAVQIVPGGEQIKNSLDILDRVGVLASEFGICRHSYIVIIGGGAVLDAVGFAAGTVHRGIRQIRVPTTVLSQDDSGVGVKNGLNRFGIKNYYGGYAPPVAVVNDILLLKTLDDRDWISGVSEAFKVAIIKDKPFLNFLIANAEKIPSRDIDAMEKIVHRSATLHVEHINVSGDPFETGSARPLDFGHWAAHKLEMMTNNELRHGEAVAIGIAIDMCCARELGLISNDDFDRVIKAMETAGMSLWNNALLERNTGGELIVIDGLELFREHLGGQLTLAMPDGLGKKMDINQLSISLVERAIAVLLERSGR
ncbi:MAG: hypothetical protein BA868_05230 [Desulfobacterales bacterium C00003106]|jgi:3-dehydroquinate synthase|nr:MAG: hypothetical protein BA868_05230 [Desulfobacterales bacterium C00003106]OEU60951.1 MAG: hypothetical protein BAW33_07670 [Desulfobacterales bacterium C00003104]